MTTHAKNTICLWYDRDAEEAARFYAATFPDSSVDAVHLAPGDYPLDSSSFSDLNLSKIGARINLKARDFRRSLSRLKDRMS
jgi:predicted 3-demethylubiquinone-9 3-methyltransferase (glyoxalase superfamily)